MNDGEEETLACFGIFGPALFSSGIIPMMFIFCCLKHKHKISKICAYNGCEIKPGETVNTGYTGYTEYCHNHQNEKTIADTTDNNHTNEEIDSNSGYEEYNDIKVTTNNRYKKTA